MLPKYFHLKALRGLRIKSPRAKLSPTRSHTKHSGLKNKIPPSEAIAYAISYKALGGLRIKSPRAKLSPTRSHTKALVGLRIKSPRVKLSPTRSHLKHSGA